MGNCLSPVLSNVYMEFYETRLARGIISDDIFWVRYVDDVFAILKVYTDLQRILTDLNNLVPSISFSIEQENNGVISFLDINILRSPDNPCYKFKVFRKPTNNNLIISNYSIHKKDIKLSALRSMFLRAFNVCSPEFIDEEIDFIYSIGIYNNFTSQDIDHSLTLARKTFYSEKRERNNKLQYISLPYHPNFDTIIHPLRLLGFCATFSYPNTIGKSLICNSPASNEGIIYKIPCRCGKFYVGQTGKTIEKRISNHQYNVGTNNTSNAICVHTNSCNFPIDWQLSKILYRNTGFIDRNVIESACIVFSKDRNFNLSPGLYKLDNFVLHNIRRQYKLDDVFN